MEGSIAGVQTTGSLTTSGTPGSLAKMPAFVIRGYRLYQSSSTRTIDMLWTVFHIEGSLKFHFDPTDIESYDSLERRSC